MTLPDRIAVTGVGLVSALGQDARTSFRRLLNGERGFAQVTLFDVAAQRAKLAAEVRDVRPAEIAPLAEADAWSRSDALAMIAAREALASAGLVGARPPLFVAVGGSTGGMYEAESVLGKLHEAEPPKASVRRLLAYPLSTTADRLSRALGAVRAVTLCSACSSSALSLVQAACWLERGEADVVLAGGTDGLCSLTFTGFNALGAMDTEACRPFDTTRAGLSLGEGAAFLVLERERYARRRGAKIHALLTGWAVGAEAHHITHPEPSGATAAALLERAMRRAGLLPSGVDYVNAHGTGTPHNDAMEARALGLAFGDERKRLLVSSSKGQLGHTLGAAGAIEAAITVLALAEQMVPPTGGLLTPDPALELRHVPGRGIAAPIRAALSSSFGFGGTGAVLAFERASELGLPDGPPSTRSPRLSGEPLLVTGAAVIGPLGVLSGPDAARALGPTASTSLDLPFDPVSELDAARSRRFDRSTGLLTACCEHALADARLPAADAGIAAGNAFGNVERCVEFLTRVAVRGPRYANPAEFPHLVPSSPAGNASIYLGARGPVVTASDLATSGEAAIMHACSLLRNRAANAMVAGGAEARDTIVTKVLGPLCGGEEQAPRSEGAGFVVIERRHTALERGARPLAEISGGAYGFGRMAELLTELSGPRDAARACIVFSAEAGELPELSASLAGSAWARVESSSVRERCGFHEAIGGVAVAAAAGRIAQGEIDDALVVSRAQGRIYLLHLSRFVADESRDAAR